MGAGVATLRGQGNESVLFTRPVTIPQSFFVVKRKMMIFRKKIRDFFHSFAVKHRGNERELNERTECGTLGKIGRGGALK